MKIRIRGNSIRLRLTKTEVETFCSTGLCSESTVFAASVFSYRLKAEKDISGLQATFTNNVITILAPMTITQDWHTSSRVGFENRMIMDSGTTLSLLIEKDFVCMDETVEDQSDNYPNPKIED